MRLFLNVSVVMACGALAGVSALAQGSPSRAAAAPVSFMVGGPAEPDATDTLMRHSSGVEAHFDAANTTHDGHLTKAQAQRADWARVVKHFDDIDSDQRGWVTADQIHAFNKSHRKRRKDATA